MRYQLILSKRIKWFNFKKIVTISQFSYFVTNLPRQALKNWIYTKNTIFFTDVKQNLGIIITLDKAQENIFDLIEKYPILYKDCHLLWLEKWSNETLRQMPQLVIQRYSLRCLAPRFCMHLHCSSSFIKVGCTSLTKMHIHLSFSVILRKWLRHHRPILISSKGNHISY